MKSSLKLPSLLKLYNRDKKLGNQALLYVFFACDLSKENPLRDLPFDIKVEDAELRVFGSKGIPEDWLQDIHKAMKDYESKVVTDEEKDIYTYDKKMDQFNTLLKDTKPKIKKNVNINTDNVSFSTNIDIINGTLKDIINIIQAKASLVALYTTGSIPKYLRGGLSPLTQGKLKTK